MQHLEVSGVVRPIYGSLGVKMLSKASNVGTFHCDKKSSPVWSDWAICDIVSVAFPSARIHDMNGTAYMLVA